jgi:hypothetical protein
MSVINQGQLSLARGQSVYVGWLTLPNEFQPLIRHWNMFGFDSGRHDVVFGSFDQEGPDFRGFGYLLTNASTGPGTVVVPLTYLYFAES